MNSENNDSNSIIIGKNEKRKNINNFNNIKRKKY